MGYLTWQDTIMKFALVVAALVSVAVASSLPHDELQFVKFREEYGKSYHTRSEHQRRFSIFTQNLRKYEQQVTACTPNPLSCGGTGGCMGSIPQLAFTYIQLFGHVTEDEWPYTVGNGNTGDCEYDYNGMPPSVGLTGYTILDPNNQDAVMQHLAEVGPLAVAVYASGWGSYSSGIYDGCSYDSNIALNHAVQLVGYGSDADGLLDCE